MEIGFFFILSQVLVGIAMLLDLVSFQFKSKKYTIICFALSASLISAHYFLLGKIVAGLIVILSVIRFIVCYFKSGKRYMVLFITLNTLVLLFTYSEVIDIVIYFGIFLVIIGNFQEKKKKMHQFMMGGTSLVVLYNILIFSPVGVITEVVFLTSNVVGYYRHYIKRPRSKEKKVPVLSDL